MYKPFFITETACLIFVSEGTDAGSLLSGTNNIFVCGGLQNPEKMSSSLGREAAFAPAAVCGYERTSEVRDGKEIPFMAPCENDSGILTGVVWLDLTDEDVSKIEGFELAGNYRKRIEIHVQAGERAVPAFTFVKALR